MDGSTPATIVRHRASIVTIGIRDTTGAGITIGATGTAGLTAMVGAIVPRATVTVRTRRAPAMIETAAGSFATDTGSGFPGIEPGIAAASSPLEKPGRKMFQEYRNGGNCTRPGSRHMRHTAARLRKPGFPLIAPPHGGAFFLPAPPILRRFGTSVRSIRLWSTTRQGRPRRTPRKLHLGPVALPSA